MAYPDPLTARELRKILYRLHGDTPVRIQVMEDGTPQTERLEIVGHIGAPRRVMQAHGDLILYAEKPEISS